MLGGGGVVGSSAFFFSWGNGCIGLAPQRCLRLHIQAKQSWDTSEIGVEASPAKD